MIDRIARPNAEASALLGLRRADARMDKAAANVAYSGLAANEASRVAFSPEGLALAETANANMGGAETAGAARPPEDLPTALVDSSIAQHEQAANIKVLQASEAMQRDLLDIVQRDR
jgi:hypothetical protein